MWIYFCRWGVRLRKVDGAMLMMVDGYCGYLLWVDWMLVVRLLA
jgi:hypothetical protein